MFVLDREMGIFLSHEVHFLSPKVHFSSLLTLKFTLSLLLNHKILRTERRAWSFERDLAGTKVRSFDPYTFSGHKYWLTARNIIDLELLSCEFFNYPQFMVSPPFIRIFKFF